MVDTSVDLEQLRATARRLRDIADSEVAAFLGEHTELVKTYRSEASLHTLDGAPAGIYADTAAALESGVRDARTKGEAIKAELLRLAEALEEHARGVESDEADASMTFSYGTTV
ncbi:hypothetical protein KL864_31120 [Mycolicibacterium goodii]|uniref:hypothetical protein n=1 Tax=Mycolicibacterium goodii TaxID=134601 RepID=UPI001BDBDC91|nr:hypothetical protein [Mycolicibacterium goodii]MBU8820334.1 hypothetical protein [Mycolicibacterium goodii]